MVVTDLAGLANLRRLGDCRKPQSSAAAFDIRADADVRAASVSERLRGRPPLGLGSSAACNRSLTLAAQMRRPPGNQGKPENRGQTGRFLVLERVGFRYFVRRGSSCSCNRRWPPAPCYAARECSSIHPVLGWRPARLPGPALSLFGPHSCPLDALHLWAALRYIELKPARAGLGRGRINTRGRGRRPTAGQRRPKNGWTLELWPEHCEMTCEMSEVRDRLNGPFFPHPSSALRVTWRRKLRPPEEPDATRCPS